MAVILSRPQCINLYLNFIVYLVASILVNVSPAYILTYYIESMIMYIRQLASLTSLFCCN